MPYYPGKYKMVCDLCGAVYLNSEMAEQWDGAWVCKKCFTHRHPQDFPKVAYDDQTVPVARPDKVLSMGSTTLAADADKESLTFDLTSATGLTDGDPISITLDNGAAHNTMLNGTPVGNTIILLDAMPSKASSGNTVYLPSINNL